MRITPFIRNLARVIDSRWSQHMDTYAQFNPSPLSMEQFLSFGRSAIEKDSFNFLRKELLVRFANTMKEIQLLPLPLLQIPSISQVQNDYAASFRELFEFKEKTVINDESLADFCEVLNIIYKRHANVVQSMAQGVLELNNDKSTDAQTETSIQYFLDRFYMSRISINMLMNQHLLLFEPNREPNQTRIGNIDPTANVKSIIKDAYKNASFLCEEYYDVAPDIDISLANASSTGNIELAYPPSHLYHILFELLKNSMRAIVEGQRFSDGELPDIAVLIAKGNHDVTIKISDQGGGIPRHITDRLFYYMFSTAPPPSMNPVKTPLAGYGFGLPLSRLYARYFHGDLILNSYEGYGTDAVIYLKYLNNEAYELLPVFNKTSSKQYKSSIPTADWTDSNSIMNRRPHPKLPSANK